MSRPFYQASAADPQGLVRRRRFGFADGELTGYEDERLADRRRPRERVPAGRDRAPAQRPDARHRRHHPARPGRHRPGPARPSRSASRAHPGTGKTAVGLHRAAYLLYTHGGQLARSGVLVVGPNRAFLRYIEQVLPTLGEVDVDQTTVAELTARVPVRAVDRPEVAVLKGDARMAEVLRRALWGEIAKPADSIQVPLAGRRYRVPVERLKRYVDDLRRRARADDDQQLLHYAAGRERLAMLLAEDARRQKEEAGGSPTRRRDRGGPHAAPRCARSATRSGRPGTPPGWSASCWRDPARLARAARGVLDDDEQALLHRPAPRSVRTAPWTDGRRRPRRRGGRPARADDRLRPRGRRRGAGPLPMQCRAVARRLAAGSLTVLGDLAQATSPWSPSDWQETLAGLGPAGHRRPPADPRLPGARRGARLRQPAAAGHRARACRRPRRSARSPARCAVRPVAALAGPLVEVVAELAPSPGSIGVVCADAAVAEVVAAADRRGLPAAALTDDGEAAPAVAVVPATLAKGLEFDAVVVVDPAAIVAAEPRGLHRLYVVLTRAVSTLVVLHRGDLPAPLAL